jgi:hypothetical protein
MSDNLDRYFLPGEFDENGLRERVAEFSREELIDMLIYAYKEKRIWAKVADVAWNKLERIKAITEEPVTTPAVPSPGDLRRMMEDDRDNRN